MLYYITLITLYYIFIVSYYKNVNNFLLILICGFKQKWKRLRKQEFKTLRGLLVLKLY